jgi:hypothetical protein
VLIDCDYGASGIWWVRTRKEQQAPADCGTRSDPPHADAGGRRRPWRELLSAELVDALREWNRDWERDETNTGPLQERGRELAICVQDELGADGWEVLYQMGSQLHRVQPPGSWPIDSWQEQLLGHAPQRIREES